jgi:hypothetical protein
MRLTLLVSTLLFSSAGSLAPAVAGTSGGGVGMKPALQLMEIMEVSRGASAISNEFYGTPDNFILDARNRKVVFEKNVEMSFEEVKESAPAVEIPEQPAEAAAPAN